MDVNLNRGGKPLPPPNPLVFVPGGLLAVFGLFVIWNPQLLHYFVGGAFSALGLVLTGLILGIRKLAARGILPGAGRNPFGG